MSPLNPSATAQKLETEEKKRKMALDNNVKVYFQGLFQDNLCRFTEHLERFFSI